MNTNNLDERRREIGAEITGCNNEITNGALKNCILDGPAKEVLRSIMFGDDFMWQKIENKLVHGKSIFTVNTYPFGEPTDIIYPQWIGIYREEEKVTGQNKLVSAAINYIEKADIAGIASKDIVILTDIVNKKFLDKLEKSFLRDYLKGNLAVYIFYVNDYGITYVPFVFSFRHFDFGDDLTYAILDDINTKMITKGYDYASVRYTSHWNAEGLSYEMIVDKNTITKKQIHPYGTIDYEETRKLSDSNKNRFVFKISKLIDSYPEADKVSACDDGFFEADLFGHLYSGSGICEFYLVLSDIFLEAYESAVTIC